ncbi:hypothetical protein [Thermodesulfovibrio yellowstonii]|uniref:hypothetical protein n=1 Tax=Thermodesulfovibrio yellowstonii TaxID=28262 RepID=UPI0004124E55|nr:hypothetical protein [Thermodesulfovibrio islandicus]
MAETIKENFEDEFLSEADRMIIKMANDIKRIFIECGMTEEQASEALKECEVYIGGKKVQMQ